MTPQESGEMDGGVNRPSRGDTQHCEASSRRIDPAPDEHRFNLKRRHLLAGTGMAIVGGLAGCLDFLGDQLTFEASPAGASEEATTETGYDHVGTDEIVVERTFEVGDDEQTVEVINWASEYEKQVELPTGDTERAAVFGVLSTPQVEVLGQTFNPVEDMDAEERAELVQDQYDEIGELEHIDDHPITILEEETSYSLYETEVELDAGPSVEVYLHISEAVASGDDFIICIGGYPTVLEDEGDNIDTLMESVVHPI